MTSKDMRSWESGNIGYIVGNQPLKWQHFWQQGGNNRQHFDDENLLLLKQTN
jgi:hypothetical protein